MDKPRIRRVEAFPIEHEGRAAICLRDPSGFAAQPLVVGPGAYFLLTLFDGAHSRLDLQAAYARRFRQTPPAADLAELIDTLDQTHFLEGDRFQQRVAAVRAEFAVMPERPAAHAGLCYPADPGPLREELAGFFDLLQGPGKGQPGGKSAPAGLIAPHIDPRRGGPAYAHSYSQLIGRKPPELLVILGTSHYGTGPELFTATTKDYATPLGAVRTDRDFLARLARRYTGGDLFADELLHRNEHSIEFQTLFLASTLGTLGYQIVPILVSSFHGMVAAKQLPARDPRVASFLGALREELGADSRSACIIAGVDFAHVGKKFGDSRPADESFVSWVRQEDRRLIETICQVDPEAFFAEIGKDGDRRRICGLAPMYTQLELLKGRRGRLLTYDVALEPPTASAVSFASLALD